MPSTKAIIRKNKVNRKGECVVYIRYGHQQKSTDISTGLKVLLKHWNDEKEKVNSVSGIRKTKINEGLLRQNEKADLYAKTIIDKIKSELISIARSMIQDDVEPGVHLVKDVFLEKKKPKNKDQDLNKIGLLFKQFIDNSSKSKRTIKNYGTASHHIMEFEKHTKKPLTVKMLDMAFYDDFVNFLYNDIKKPDNTKGLAHNSVATTIKNLKVFLVYLEKRGYNFQHLIPYLKATYQDTPIYFLTEDELDLLYNYKFESSRLEKVRDLFVLNCYLGLRVSDLTRLTKDHITDGAIELKALKNQKDVFIPLTPVSIAILEKYNYEIPFISDQKMNEYIKEACEIAKIDQKVEEIKMVSGNKTYELVPKWQVITTHIAIKTFISLCSKKGISPKIVSEITGKTVRVILKHYYGIDKKTIKDQMLSAFS